MSDDLKVTSDYTLLEFLRGLVNRISVAEDLTQRVQFNLPSGFVLTLDIEVVDMVKN